MTHDNSAVIDIDLFRNVFAGLAGAVSVLTAGSGADRTGLTATSVSAFSAEPPTIGIYVNTNSSAWEVLQRYHRFCVNILSREQEGIAANFAGRDGLKGTERYRDGAWTTLESGAPVLEGALANIDCLLEDTILRHSHAIVLGRIVALRSKRDAQPLLYWRRNYFGLNTRHLAAAE